MMSTTFPHNWYWIVGGAGPHLPNAKAKHPAHTRVFSSAAMKYVPSQDPEYLRWRKSQMDITGMKEPATRIDTEENLAAVLKQHSLGDPNFGSDSGD